jgi:hypothetical protein
MRTPLRHSIAQVLKIARACRQAIWLQLSPRECRRCRLTSSALAPG